MDITVIAANIPKPIIVSLKQVAAWDLEHLNAPCDEIKASVPALQRGLVWNPHQVELLWDSILRGFPIGSFVVSKKNDNQERSGKADVTHHLLDGQQRANAITLGFHDPNKYRVVARQYFPVSGSSTPRKAICVCRLPFSVGD